MPSAVRFPLTFFCILVLLGSTVTAALPPVINAIHNRIPIGGVVHIFPRFGYLSLSMRVVPRNDSQSWIFMEPVKLFFLPTTIRIEEKFFVGAPLPIQNLYHVDLCEDMNQLLQAFFIRFTIQGLDKPWRAFSGGWRTPSLARYFGIDPNFVVGEYRYMLVRAMTIRNTGTMMPLSNVSVTPEMFDQVQKFGALGDQSMYNFSNAVGTHYIQSYLAGNSVYQVYVYDVPGFEAVKRKLNEYSGQTITQLPSLVPFWARQIGKVFVLNAQPKTVAKVQQLLTTEVVNGTSIPSIFKLHNNPALMREMELILRNEPNGLLGIELKTLDIVFTDIGQRSLFIQSLKHLLHLWEINFQ